MPTSKRLKAARDKVTAHRNRLRKQGLRPIQIWVPDVRSADFAVEAHKSEKVVVVRISTDRGDKGRGEQLSSSEKIREFIGVLGRDKFLERRPVHDFDEFIDSSR